MVEGPTERAADVRHLALLRSATVFVVIVGALYLSGGLVSLYIVSS